jgi:hypothetical protein
MRDKAFVRVVRGARVFITLATFPAWGCGPQANVEDVNQPAQTVRAPLLPTGPDGITFRMTTVDLGDLEVIQPAFVTVGAMDTSFNGIQHPPLGTEFGPLFQCTPNGPSDGSAGICLENPLINYAYPDPVTGACPPAGSSQNTQCVGSTTSFPEQHWLRSVPLDPAGPNTVRIDVVFHVLEGLFELSFGIHQADLRFTLFVDRTTGVVTPGQLTDFHILQVTPNCVTTVSALVPSNGRPPKFCWDITLGPTFPPPVPPTPFPPFPWDVINATPDATTPPPPIPLDPNRDPNGFPLNPRWRWQTVNRPPLAWDDCVDDGFPSEPCTSQPLEINDPGFFTLGFINPHKDGVTSCGVDGQHTNWQVVTYTGHSVWSSHSVGSTQDDDYNIRLLTPPALGDGLPSGMTATNKHDYDPLSSTNHDVHHSYLMMEFEQFELAAVFNRVPYWAEFMRQVNSSDARVRGNPQNLSQADANNDNVDDAHKVFHGTETIVIGLLGTDQSHESKSEMHPPFALAFHTKTDLNNDIWDMFARNTGDEGLCSSGLEVMFNANDPTQGYDLLIALPRPAGVAGDVIPAVATDFGKSDPTGPKVRMRMTSVDLGAFNSSAPSTQLVTVSMETHFNGASVPPLGQANSVFSCTPNGTSAESCLDPRPWLYPDAITRLCPPAGSPPNSRCVVPSVAQVDTNWMREALVDPAGPNIERIDVILHVTEGLFERSFGQSRAEVPFTLNFDRTTGITTPGQFDDQHIKALTGQCATMRSGFSGGDDPVFCWTIENVPLPPPPPTPAPPRIEVFPNAGFNSPVFVVFHMPAPPLDGIFYGDEFAGEVRLDWTSPTPPPAPAQPLAFGIMGTPATPEDMEEELETLYGGLTSTQRAQFDSLVVPLPAKPPAVSIPVGVVMGPPPPSTASPVAAFIGVAPINDHRESITRAYCAVMGGQIPTSLGSCEFYPPSTKLANSGTPAASGWFTSPVTITLTATSVGNGIDHTEYSFDGGATWIRYTAPFVAPEGAITIAYRSVDQNGATESYQQQSFRIDTRPPTSTASVNAVVQPAVLSFTVTDPIPGSGPKGIHTVSRVGNTSQLDNRFTPGASGTVVLNTQCTDIEFWGEDVAGLQETTHHHLTDSAPPELTVPGSVTTSTCTTSATVQVGQATATDECLASVPVTGQVIATNGTPLATPIPVVNGSVSLGIGVHTIRWSATDGLHPVTGTQTVTVGTRIEAKQSFTVEDRASVTNFTGGFAAVLNAGTGTAQIGNDSRSGAVMSVGPIRVLHRAVVNGDATSGSTVFKESDGTITGTIRQNASVVLPALATLPAFPSPTAGSFTVASGTVTKNPGSYSTASVSGGTLVLKSGDYFFQSLTINANVTVRATPTTRVFVRDTFAFRSPFRASSGTAVQPLFVGFAGSAATLEAQLDGTLLAPNATVNFGVDTSITFTGSYFARAIDVRPASILRCK